VPTNDLKFIEIVSSTKRAPSNVHVSQNTVGETLCGLRPRYQQSSCELKKRRVAIPEPRRHETCTSVENSPGSVIRVDSRKIVIVTHDSAQTDRSNEVQLNCMK